MVFSQVNMTKVLWQNGLLTKHIKYHFIKLKKKLKQKNLIPSHDLLSLIHKKAFNLERVHNSSTRRFLFSFKRLKIQSNKSTFRKSTRLLIRLFIWSNEQVLKFSKRKLFFRLHIYPFVFSQHKAKKIKKKEIVFIVFNLERGSYKV